MKTKWREQIDMLKQGECVIITYTKKEKTLRGYLSNTVSKINNAKYSINKLDNNQYKITRL